MDILHKLRILFWLLVLTLWGTFMYQFMKDDAGSLPKVSFIKSPFVAKAKKFLVAYVPVHPVKSPLLEASSSPIQEIPPTEAEVSTSAAQPQEPVTPPEEEQQPAPSSLTKPEPTEGVTGVYEKEDDISSSPTQETRQAEVQKLVAQPQEEEPQWPEPPPGFERAETNNFVIYKESGGISDDLKRSLELLHGNLMLDLISFSPWSRNQKVLIYIFTSYTAYQTITGRPAWSGGASSMSRRTIYVVESRETMGVLAHELTHIFFDSFFTNKPNPLWLSEGMAVFIQTERGQSPPNWLGENLSTIKRGGGFKLEDLMKLESLEGLSDRQVRLWYTQSYSLVRFMMRMKTGDSFYKFCAYIKEDSPVAQSLFRAYGMPFNRVAALEYAWRYDIKTKKITSLLEQ